MNPVSDECFIELESKGWFIQDNVLLDDECLSLKSYIDYHLEKDNFRGAGIGNRLNLKKNTQIRSSQIAWINHWYSILELSELSNWLTDLQASLNRYFFMAIKRFESQFAVYEEGDFYRKHLDQLNDTKHRQVTVIFYLNDCFRGGELVIYTKDNRNRVDRVINPRAGQLVCFLSSQIFHEVYPAVDKRYSLTTWFRDDLIVF